MSNTYYKESLRELGRALGRLGAALQLPLDSHDLILDGTIQRFEFVIELYGKALRQILLDTQQVRTVFPKEALQQAYKAGWITNEKLWIGMIEDRNKTSHTYKHEKAMEIYEHIKVYYPEMHKTYELLITQFPIA
jgi:nucleotidyltransferase substrate binding protein (TIGR01987 family)